MFALFVKNLFLGPFTVARVSARLGGTSTTDDVSEPPSDDPAAAGRGGSSRKGGRWWPAAVALGGLFYMSIACQVTFHSSFCVRLNETYYFHLTIVMKVSGF